MPPRFKGALVAAAAALAGCAAASPQSSQDSTSQDSTSQDSTSLDHPITLVGDSQCDCFLTNGTSPGYYSRHMFFDFRSLPQYASADAPPFVLNETQAAIAPVTSDYFAGALWNGTWQIQGWDNKAPEGHGLAGNSTVLMVNSQSNVFIQQNADRPAASQTFMSMRTKRLPGFQTTAAFQSRANDFHFLSVRVLARTVGSPGAVTAMFTYREDAAAAAAAVQEADLEVLTRGPRETVQYTNQPGFGPDGLRNTRASLNTTLPDALLWSDWAVHRLDWTPAGSVWFVNGRQTANISTQVPRDPSSLNFNSWSDGGPWSGNMTLYDEARLEIQWIEVVYNSTAQAQAGASHAQRRSSGGADDHYHLGPHGRLVRRKGPPGCKVVCSIDESPELGRTALLWNSTAARTAGADLRSSMAWLWSLMMGTLLWYSLV